MRSRVQGTARNADDRRGLVPANWHGAFPTHALTAADAVASCLGHPLVRQRLPLAYAVVACVRVECGHFTGLSGVFFRLLKGLRPRSM